MNASETPAVTLEDVLRAENLNEAWARVKANAGAAGVDGRTVAQIAELLREHKEPWLELIRAGKYLPEAVKAVDIPKANRGVRRLGVPTVLDRPIGNHSFGRVDLRQPVGRIKPVSPAQNTLRVFLGVPRFAVAQHLAASLNRSIELSRLSPAPLSGPSPLRSVALAGQHHPAPARS